MRKKRYTTDDVGCPERDDHEDWYHYAKRWWYYWAGLEADKRRLQADSNKIRIQDHVKE